jgi:GTP-binding protein
VIIGFPNVGKSTLFNRLLKQKKSLVHSLPGMTRDAVSAPCAFGGKKFVLVDTGGFFGVEEEPLSFKVGEKAWESAQKADLVLFVLDGRRELLPDEKDLYLSLKKLNTPILAVVNKMEMLSEAERVAGFYELGEKQLFAVSAEHNINIDLLLEAIVAALPPGVPGEEEEKPLRIAIIGRINVGKSSLINRLYGEEKLIVSEIPGTTRDSTDTLIIRNKKAFCLVDTAGIRKLGNTRDKREKAGIIKAKINIGQADVVCLVLDALEFPTRQDAAVAQLAHTSGKPLIIVLNKWDLVRTENKDMEAFKGKLFQRLDFVSYAPVLFCSALTGQRVVKILDFAEQVHADAGKRIETSKLNRFLANILAVHSPRSKDKGRIKVKFMAQKGVLPPTFILFTHTQTILDPAYEKFFVRRLREEFGIWGTPIRIFLRKS